MSEDTRTETYRHAFANGRIVTIKPVQRVALSLIRTALDKKYPKPAPPINDTDLGPIPNAADPAYDLAVQEWDRQQGGRTLIHMLKFSIVFDADQVAADLAKLDDDQARINAYLSEVGLPAATFNDIDGRDVELFGEMDDDRRYLHWLYYVACEGKGAEVAELINAVNDISDQEASIKAAMPTFRG